MLDRAVAVKQGAGGGLKVVTLWELAQVVPAELWHHVKIVSAART